MITGKIESGENLVKNYFDSVSRYTLLDAEEEFYLASRKTEGDESAKTRLINANLRLVIKIAKGYLVYEKSLIDLIQEGNIGLIRAAEKFNPDMGCRFSTYSSYWIKHYITRFIAKRSRSIRIPIRKGDLFKKISHVRDEYLSAEGREPSVQEISNHLGVGEKNIQEMIDLFQPVLSLESPVNDDDYSMMEFISDSKNREPEEKIINSELNENISEVLSGLIDNEKKILQKRFGLVNGMTSTLKEIGQEMGVSAETIRQIENRALDKIRQKHSYLREYIAC